MVNVVAIPRAGPGRSGQASPHAPQGSPRFKSRPRTGSKSTSVSTTTCTEGVLSKVSQRRLPEAADELQIPPQ